MEQRDVMEQRDILKTVLDVDLGVENDAEIEFVGKVEDVTYGWFSHTYDVWDGDRQD